jgi:hypothetical protein
MALLVSSDWIYGGACTSRSEYSAVSSSGNALAADTLELKTDLRARGDLNDTMTRWSRPTVLDHRGYVMQLRITVWYPGTGSL